MKSFNLNPKTLAVTFVASTLGEASQKAKADEMTFSCGQFTGEQFQTADLLKMFNLITGEDVKRFATRSAGVVRLIKALDAMPLTPAETPKEEPKPAKAPAKAVDHSASNKRIGALLAGEKAPAKAKTAKPLPEGAYVVPADWKFGVCPRCGSTELTTGESDGAHVFNEHKSDCHSCGLEFYTETGKPVRKSKLSTEERGLAIAKSWLDPDVKAARSARHHVRVAKGGKAEEYTSVREAFVKLGLPIKEHIRFRGELKKAGQLKRYDYGWTLIEA